MNPRLLALLGVRHGEGARTGRLFVLILLLTLTVAVAKAAQQGIFLATAARERIADAFVLSALVLALCSLVVSAVAGRVGPVRLFVGLATAVAVLFIGAWTVFLVHADPMALYVLVQASIGLMVVQGWSVATEALDVRSAKRLLPVIGNAAGLGWTLGGFAVAPLSHLIGAVALVPVAAGLLLATAALALGACRKSIGCEISIRLYTMNLLRSDSLLASQLFSTVRELPRVNPCSFGQLPPSSQTALGASRNTPTRS